MSTLILVVQLFQFSILIVKYLWRQLPIIPFFQFDAQLYVNAFHFTLYDYCNFFYFYPTSCVCFLKGLVGVLVKTCACLSCVTSSHGLSSGA